MADTTDDSAARRHLRWWQVYWACQVEFGVPFEGLRELAAKDIAEALTALAAGDGERCKALFIAALPKLAAMDIGARYIAGTETQPGDLFTVRP